MSALLAQAFSEAPQLSKGYGYTAFAIGGIIMLAFFLKSWREVLRIFVPGKNMGWGFARIWAVARVAIHEAWSARVWVVPILWLIAILVINTLVIPYKEATETISLYTQICLYGQMFLVLLALMVLASFSIARERERRTIITTGSKPLSRLEFFLGKITGFSAVALMLLFTMGLLTYGYLYWADQHIRGQAAAQYQIEEEHYNRAQGAGNNGLASEAVQPPSEALKKVARNGVLIARNYIAPVQMQVAGLIEHTPAMGTIRCLKGGGGSGERMVLRFPTFYSRGPELPRFTFLFPAFKLRDDVKAGDTDKFTPLPANAKIDLRVVIGPVTGSPQDRYVEHVVSMTAAQQMPGYFAADYAPELPLLYVPANHPEITANIEVQVSCLTPGVYLQIMDTADPQIMDPTQYNVFITQFVPGERNITLDVPMRAPRVLGFESHDKQQIDGPSTEFHPKLGMYNNGEVASFRFTQEELKEVPRDAQGNVTLSMYLDVDKREQTNVQTAVDVEVYEDKSGLPPVRVNNVAVNEKDLTNVKIPLGSIGKNGDVFVDIRCAVAGHWVAIVKDSVRFERDPSFFLVNLLKSELVIFCSAMLLVTIAVVASVRVNGWVAMLVSVFAYFLGHALPFLQQTITDGSDSLSSPGQLARFEGDWWYKCLGFLEAMAVKVVYVVSLMLPDFRHFDPTAYILHYRNLPWLQLLMDLGWMCWFALPLIALGQLMIRKQELA